MHSSGFRYCAAHSMPEHPAFAHVISREQRGSGAVTMIHAEAAWDITASLGDASGSKGRHLHDHVDDQGAVQLHIVQALVLEVGAQRRAGLLGILQDLLLCVLLHAHVTASWDVVDLQGRECVATTCMGRISSMFLAEAFGHLSPPQSRDRGGCAS